MTEMLTDSEMVRQLCKCKNKWGLWLVLRLPENDEPWPEDDKWPSAPYLTHIDANCGPLLFLCDTKEEAFGKYNQTVGDDGPTKLNPYNGPYTTYAEVIGPDGKSVTHNT